jgi:DNA polymerase III alpha subunit (gram-positive type)
VRGFPHAYAATRVDVVPPAQGMSEFVSWVKSFPEEYGRPVCVAYPAGFDFSWIYSYLTYFDIPSPFNWAALDIRTLAMALGNTTYSGATKRDWKKRWKSKRRHNHVAVSDAIEQGESFIVMLKELRELHDPSESHT